MRKDFFFCILLIIGALAILADIAFIIYLSVMLSSILQGLSFLPTFFSTVCIALISANAVAVTYAIIYIFALRK